MHDHDDPCPSASAEALIAGAVALMTAWAESCPGRTAEPPAQRAMADRLVMHLYILSLHPDVSPALRTSMAQAHQRWVQMVREPVSARHMSSAELAAH